MMSTPQMWNMIACAMFLLLHKHVRTCKRDYRAYLNSYIFIQGKDWLNILMMGAQPQLHLSQANDNDKKTFNCTQL